ncbi:hypothetical protein [Chitinophaga solisilvae]|uniref:hypothetical protein n=1 Tax=Chitinophaga solisilvae TaxID=1233460 RepID=UPI001370938E|nr:hypothetical protein [Chitinophaga solisilvae]
MAKNQWLSTLAFRNFRDKTSDLSDIYWTQQLGADCLAEVLGTKDPDHFSVNVINSSFKHTMHPQKVSETQTWLPTFMERNRLHILVIYTAFLETYLKEITFYHIASLGHITNNSETEAPLKLKPVGEAIATPILKSSTVPDMIKYASELYEIDFGVNATEWIKLYKIRCAAAHNGGIATPKFLKAISGQPLSLRPTEYENIGLTWDELRTAMKYGDKIASLIDSKVSNNDVRYLETEQILRELASSKKLPDNKIIWQYFHEKYAIMLNKSEKRKVLRKFYGII